MRHVLLNTVFIIILALEMLYDLTMQIRTSLLRRLHIHATEAHLRTSKHMKKNKNLNDD